MPTQVTTHMKKTRTSITRCSYATSLPDRSGSGGTISRTKPAVSNREDGIGDEGRNHEDAGGGKTTSVASLDQS